MHASMPKKLIPTKKKAECARDASHSMENQVTWTGKGGFEGKKLGNGSATNLTIANPSDKEKGSKEIKDRKKVVGTADGGNKHGGQISKVPHEKRKGDRKNGVCPGNNTCAQPPGTYIKTPQCILGVKSSEKICPTE